MRHDTGNRCCPLPVPGLQRLAFTVCLSLALLCPVPVSAAPAARTAIDLQQEMPRHLFEQAGLDRLSEAEIAVLQDWLQARKGKRSAPVPGPAEGQQPGFGQEQLAQAPEPAGTRIRARIKGPFTGWSGKTVFLLDNGQVWRQRIGGRYRYNAQSPEVEVFKGRFGYYMKVLDTGRQVGVRRQK